MKLYRATVHIMLPADVQSESEAADAIHGALNETLLQSGAILDWQYAEQGLERVDGPDGTWPVDGVAINLLPTI